MVTLKFKAEKVNKHFVITPTIAVDYSEKVKNRIYLFFGWFNVIFNIDIEWSEK